MRSPAVLLLLALALALALPAAAAREAVSLDLGWRFYRGVPEGECTDPFTTNMSMFQCNGLQQVLGATDAAACAAACCELPSCEIWQFERSSPATCWIGQLVPPCNPSTDWLSFANTSRNGVPPWAAPTYADANWTVVDAPHDFIIVGDNASASPYSQSADQGQAFIPKTVGAYRKHFALPAR
jgi:hypothetical protein